MQIKFILLSISAACAQCLFAQQFEFTPRAQGSLLENDSYLVDFNVSRRIPNWTYYTLNESMTVGKFSKPSNFKSDTRLQNPPLRHDDYTHSGYNRGHLKPAGDSKLSEKDYKDSFLMTNVVPQNPQMNQQIWKELEELNRSWVRHYGQLHIITGTSTSTIDSIGENTIHVPSALWKATLRLYPDTSCIAFMVPNDDISHELENYQLSVDSLEYLIGIDLFHQLPDAIETEIEKSLNHFE
jgi:endonuclease G, mitochondrial